MKKYLSLVAFLAIVFAIAAIGSYATMPSVQSWYPTINKPAWSPPDAVFGPVWTILYIMIAIAGWRVWERLPKTNRLTNPTLAPYWLQLAFNAAWPVIFFAFHHIALAAIDIIALLISVAATISTFSKIDKTAAWLLAPYFLWVTFAACLNAAILGLN